MQVEELLAILEDKGLDDSAKLELLSQALELLNQSKAPQEEPQAEEKKASELLGVAL